MDTCIMSLSNALKNTELKLDVLQSVIHTLRSQAQTLSVAESCTGGKLASFIVEQPGVSDIFKGGIVAYSNDSKKNILNVSAIILQQYGAVSVQTAEEMALGSLNIFRSSWSLSITGVAGPQGGTVDKPVGTVCFAICRDTTSDPKSVSPTVIHSVQLQFEGSRSEIQNQSANMALQLLVQNWTR